MESTTNHEMANKGHEEGSSRGFFGGWSFWELFSGKVTDEDEKAEAASKLGDELRSHYPENAPEIIDFLARVLRRRQGIVDRLKEYPELNDHGFFMVICKLYRDTYLGIGHSSNRISHLIEIFSTARISRATAVRTLQKANEVKVFMSKSDPRDKRKQLYFLHPEMIELCSEAFGGMIDDVIVGKERVDNADIKT